MSKSVMQPMLKIELMVSQVKVKGRLQKTLMISQHLKNGLQEVVELQVIQDHAVTNELKIKDTLSLTKDINNFKEALKKNNHKLAFMNAASPGVISAFLPNKFYENDDEYLYSLSKIMQKEYEEIVSNDIYLQLDCPDLALARHMTFKDLSEEDFLKKSRETN